MEIYSHMEENYSKRKISDFLYWTQIAFISEFFFFAIVFLANGTTILTIK